MRPGNSRRSQARYHAHVWRETLKAAAAAGIDTTNHGKVRLWKMDQDLAAIRRDMAEFNAGMAARKMAEA